MTRSIDAPSPLPRPIAHAPHGDTAAATSSFRALVGSSARRLAEGDRMLASVVSQGGGRVLSTDELLALQAGIYRYTHELELAGRLVDRATQTVKTTLQSQS